jgi:hypothetical protein
VAVKRLEGELNRQKLEVAKVLEQMLGMQDALDYLRREGLVPEPPAPAAKPPARGAPADADPSCITVQALSTHAPAARD